MKKIFTFKYFLICAGAGLLLSLVLMFLACDAFALTKPEGTVTIELTDKPDTDSLADKLKENGLITSKLWFKTYLKLRNKDFESTEPGSYDIPLGSGFDGIHRILSVGDKVKRSQVKVTIPEGSTVKDIIKIICEDYGICSEEELTEEIQNGDFSEYDFVSALPDGRKYRLEGYLYPDTYFFYSDSSAHSVVNKMLSNFDDKFDSRYRAACKKVGLSYDEAVTLASMIIKEGKFAEGCGFYKLFWLFLIGALLGDFTETIFCRITGGVWMSRSSLVWGPFSIVWGLAITLATTLLYKDRDKPDRHIFFVGTFLGGAYEYVCSVFTELVFGQVFWDYSQIPFNLGGRVNLLYCFFWGIAAVVWIKLLYPRFSGWIERIPKIAGYIATWILVVFMAADIIVSSAALVRYDQRAGGEAADHGWEQLIDENFDDGKMQRIYPNAKQR